MRKNIHKYVKSCDSCQKKGGTRPTEPLNPIKVGPPFDRVGIDLQISSTKTSFVDTDVQLNFYPIRGHTLLVEHFNRTLCESLAKVSTDFEQEWDIFISSVLLAYRTLKQDTTKHTLFDLTYGKTAILPISFTVEIYPAQPINENNFQEMLQQRAYTLLSTLEEKRRIAATHIEHSQA
ncbi:hypothetical protein G9A89_012740 [Geosiphon pyriformis]|nr:hypothetical protein G9A89_012740 [Geosiphon pyriformis]